MYIGFDEYELGPGMAISFDASAPHRLWAIGEERAETIWFVVVVGRQNDSRRPQAVIRKRVLSMDPHPPVYINTEILNEEDAR